MREAIFEIVYGTMEKEGHSDELFHRVVGADAARQWSPQEKRFIRRVSYGSIERAGASDRVIDLFSKTPAGRLKPVIRTILRMGIYELWYMDSVPASATCNEMVKLAKKKKFSGLSGFVNGVLRNIARTDPDSICRDVLKRCVSESEKCAFLYSVPEDLVQLLKDGYGMKTAKKILESFSEENPITIRLQTSNVQTEKVVSGLVRAGIKVTPCRYVEHAFILSGVENVEKLPGFQEGYFTIQDESSMLPVMVAGIKPGDCVIDVCSSPGGKACHAADLLRGNGIVSARDVSDKKIERIRENAERLNISNLEMKVWDGTVPDNDWKERADVVITDVPCSGIGVIGRKPEIRYQAVEHATQLKQIQRDIVRGAVNALKPGGTLIYSTCTINPAENEENARWISEELGLAPVSLDESVPEELRSKMTREGMLQILPGVHEGNGFFVAKYRKMEKR